jgi:hypothetical protein
MCCFTSFRKEEVILATHVTISFMGSRRPFLYAVEHLLPFPTFWSIANFMMKSDTDFIFRVLYKTSQLMIPAACLLL